ncbi:hypothetical protein [Chlorogloeopsis sp. ULAP02]|uniref:hypothetical protein n=1 Tax=Chlorogloeopsis sp. ULAP02 TaxID=3107926 RepID=UPI003134F99B
MSKYDRIFNSEEVLEESLTPEEAVAAIAVVTAVADSSLEKVDADFLVDILWGFEIFEEYSDDELLEIVDKLISLAEDEGVGTLFNTAYECLADELILDGFAAGVSVLVDEEELKIPESKIILLKNLQEGLEIENEEAKEVIEEVINSFEEVEEEDADDEYERVFEQNYNQEIYESPLGNFTVIVPVSLQQGGRIDSQEGAVSFSDDFGTLLRIDYYSLPSQEFIQIDAVGQEEYLRSILLNKYVPGVIAANLPDASVGYTEYLPDTLEGAYFTLIDMPEGSTISKTQNNGTAVRLNAYRGLLAFIYGDFLYIVNSQHSFFDGETPDSIKEEAEEFKRKLLNFINTITFT